MSGYTRSIHSIERSHHYIPIQSTRQYSDLPIPISFHIPSNDQQQWHKVYNLAAESVAEWLQIASKAKVQIDGMLLRLGGRNGIEVDVSAEDGIREIVQLINELDRSFRSHGSNLKQEVWAVIELALRHPAMSALGIKKGKDMTFHWQSPHAGAPANHFVAYERKQESLRMLVLKDKVWLRRLLLGSEGLLNDLKRALSYGEQQKTMNLLQLPFHATFPYSIYYGAMQAHTPLPFRGLVLNKLY